MVENHINLFRSMFCDSNFWAGFIFVCLPLVLTRLIQTFVVICQDDWQPVSLEESLSGWLISVPCDLSISFSLAQIYAKGVEVHNDSDSGHKKAS